VRLQKFLVVALLAIVWMIVPAAHAADDGGTMAGDGGAADSSGLTSGDSGAALTAGQNTPVGNLDPTQIGQIKDMMAQGGPTPQQMQQLCAGIAAKHVSPADLESVGASLGLSPDQISQLKNCTKSGAPEEAARPGQQTAQQIRRPPKPLPKGLSPIEASFRDGSAQRLMKPDPNHLRQFGYTLFSSQVSTFAPVGNVPVGADYILGPGDALNVLFWGRLNRTMHLSVERDGSVLMPETGPIQVAGLTFEQAKKLIESRAGQITGVQVDVTMGTLRTIQVFVIGKVKQPGLYTVSALSHVSNALVAAGGISKIGSLRRIELRRNNRTIRTIDLYDMLLRGDTSADLQLEQGDVIFVPVIGPVVGVVGNVKDSAIYELRGGESLGRVLAMAGGVGPFGYAQRIQIERIENHERRIALDIDLASLSAARFSVRDGDLIKVFTVLPQQQNVLRLKGNVHRPGIYEWRPGMRVTDLLQLGEGVADHTFFDYALVRRIEGPDRQVRFLPVNLGEALADPDSATANLMLQPRDTLTIYNEREVGDLPKVAVAGAVRKPGSFRLTQGMKVSDLIYEAGGLKDNAYLPHAEIARTIIVNGTAHYINLDVDLTQVLSGDLLRDPILHRGDMLFVQEASNWHKPWTVRVEGEVMRPGPYVISEGERLDSILIRCGGLRPDAYLPAAIFIRKSVKQLEQQRLDESRQRLENAVAQLALKPQQLGAADTDKSSLEMVQRLLADTKAQQAVGRIVIHLVSVDELPASHDDLVLQDGDRLIVPKHPAAVAVLGQVYNPGAIIYEPGLTVRSYLARAGGASEWADADHILVIKANGEVLTDQGIRDSGENRFFPLLPVISGGLMDVRLEPGDTIYVPDKLVYVSGLKYATDITQIIANSATALAVVGILATSL